MIEPWFDEGKFKAGNPNMTAYDGKNIKIARLNVARVRNNISILEMHYLIAEKNGKVEYFKDRHELGLFDINKTLRIIGQEGLNAKFLPNGLMKDRGVYIGIKN